MPYTDHKKIVALRKEGKTYAEIQEEAGVSQSTVYNALRKAGLTSRINSSNKIPARKKREIIHLYSRGLTYTEVAERTGVPRSSCHVICSDADVTREPIEAQRKLHQVDQEQVDRALKLYQAGMALEAIAKLTGLDRHQITQYARTEGIARSQQEAATNRYGNPVHHLARVRKRKIRKAKQLHYQGVSIERISEVIDVHQRTARRYVKL